MYCFFTSTILLSHAWSARWTRHLILHHHHSSKRSFNFSLLLLLLLLLLFLFGKFHGLDIFDINLLFIVLFVYQSSHLTIYVKTVFNTTFYKFFLFFCKIANPQLIEKEQRNKGTKEEGKRTKTSKKQNTTTQIRGYPLLCTFTPSPIIMTNLILSSMIGLSPGDMGCWWEIQTETETEKQNRKVQI